MSTFLLSYFSTFYLLWDEFPLLKFWYSCAVLLIVSSIVSSIVMVAYQVVHIDDVAGGLLYYVAQSFLLAGSIFGLDQYLRIIKKHYHEKTNE